jgi:hypothetical protein
MKEFQLQPFLLKNNNMSIFLNWKVTRYAIFFILSAIALGSLSVINHQTNTSDNVTRLAQVALFIFLGIIHADSLSKRPIFTHHSIKEKCYFSFALTLFIYGFLLLYYSVVRSNLQQVALASCCSFLLPYFIVQSWNFYLVLEDNNSMIWKGYKYVADSPDVVYLNTLLINIRLSRKARAKEETSFLINTPLNMELGKLFNSFLNVEKRVDETAIDSMGDYNKPYGWKFYLVSFGGVYKRILDPNKSLQGNKNIKRNATILAKRVHD